MLKRQLEVYVAHSDGSSQRQLTFPAGAELRSEFPTWSPNGSSIAVLREFPNSSAVEIIPVASGKTRLLHVHGLISQSAWGKPGIAYLALQSGSNDVFTIRIADPSTGRGRPFASPAVGYSVQAMSWSSRAELAALEASLPYESDKQEVTVYTGDGRRVARFAIPKQWVACGAAWSPNGTRLLLTVYRRGHFNAKTRQPTPQLDTVDPSGKHWQRLRLGLPLASCGVSWR